MSSQPDLQVSDISEDDNVDDYLSHFEHCMRQRLEQLQEAINAYLETYRSTGDCIWQPFHNIVNARLEECHTDADKLVESLKKEIGTERK